MARWSSWMNGMSDSKNPRIRPRSTVSAGLRRVADGLAPLAAVTCSCLWFVSPGVVADGCRADPASSAAGVKVYLDPETGELLDHAPPDAPAELPPESPAAEPEIPVMVRPDGTVVADVGNRFRSELRVEVIEGQAVTCHRTFPEDAIQPGASPPGEKRR